MTCVWDTCGVYLTLLPAPAQSNVLRRCAESGRGADGTAAGYTGGAKATPVAAPQARRPGTAHCEKLRFSRGASTRWCWTVRGRVAAVYGARAVKRRSDL